MSTRAAVLALIALALARSAAGYSDASPWDLPPPGACDAEPPRLLAPPRQDAAPASTPKPGETITNEHSLRLRDLLPPELWEKRDRFLFDGMHMEIGPCYRDYGPPAFFVEATRKLHGAVTLNPDGTLSGYKAGLPFPPETITPDDPRAGEKWAWNWVHRWAGAGEFSEHQLSVVNDKGVAEQWRGDQFFLQIRGRADRAADDYVYPAKLDAEWASGGSTQNLKTGGSCVFRQYATGGRKPDLFEGSSDSRKMSRVPPPDSEGPLSACLVDAAIGAGLFLHGGSPNLHEWKVRGVVDLLAPINAAKGTWPVDADRGYGPWGISFADDRWEQRRVLVLDGKLKPGLDPFEDGTVRFVWYLDLQTLAPLYYAAYRKSGDAAGVGYFVSRWSEDRPDYPHWSDDPARPVRVLDPIGEAMVDWNDQHAVRAEQGRTVAVPTDETKLRRNLSVGSVRLH
jgi:hypothetical protein